VTGKLLLIFSVVILHLKVCSALAQASRHYDIAISEAYYRFEQESHTTVGEHVEALYSLTRWEAIVQASRNFDLAMRDAYYRFKQKLPTGGENEEEKAHLPI
jgi:hypothetical protein